MAIGNVMEKGNLIYAYDEKNKQLFAKPFNSKNGAKLMGYTNSTVNIKKGNLVYTYDEKGKQISARPA